MEDSKADKTELTKYAQCEQYTEGNWLIRKYADGFVEMWWSEIQSFSKRVNAQSSSINGTQRDEFGGIRIPVSLVKKIADTYDLTLHKISFVPEEGTTDLSFISIGISSTSYSNFHWTDLGKTNDYVCILAYKYRLHGYANLTLQCNHTIHVAGYWK